MENDKTLQNRLRFGKILKNIREKKKISTYVLNKRGILYGATKTVEGTYDDLPKGPTLDLILKYMDALGITEEFFQKMESLLLEMPEADEKAK